MAKRYDLNIVGGHMYHDGDAGSWVLFDDYATLESENAKLKEESREFRGMDASVGIADPCPSCGQKKLFVGTGGYLTCSGSKCNAPCAIGDVAKENAKLRDLLRRVYACAENGSSAVDTTVRLALMLPEIAAVIEPAGEATS